MSFTKRDVILSFIILFFSLLKEKQSLLFASWDCYHSVFKVSPNVLSHFTQPKVNSLNHGSGFFKWFLESSISFSTKQPLLSFLKRFIYLREREHEQRGRRRGKWSQADSVLSSEPHLGLVSWSWDHDLSWNQEWDAYPTELPRHPFAT